MLGADAGRWAGVTAGDGGSSLPNTVTFISEIRSIVLEQNVKMQND